MYRSTQQEWLAAHDVTADTVVDGAAVLVIRGNDDRRLILLADGRMNECHDCDELRLDGNGLQWHRTFTLDDVPWQSRATAERLYLELPRPPGTAALCTRFHLESPLSWTPACPECGGSDFRFQPACNFHTYPSAAETLRPHAPAAWWCFGCGWTPVQSHYSHLPAIVTTRPVQAAEPLRLAS